MKIYCPQCHTCYSIEKGLIPPDGKTLRCSRCGKVWTCYHSDMEEEIAPEDSEAPQNVIANEDDSLISTPAGETSSPKEEDTQPLPLPEDEMNAIFSRLKDENSKLDTEMENLSPAKKIFPRIKKLLGWNSYLTIFIELFVIILIIGLSIFGNRYELVRRFPQTEVIFKQLGIPAKIVGEGLEFQNIVRSYDSKEQPRLLTIKGYIYNTTNKELSIPTILINIMDKDGEMMLQDSQKIETDISKAQSRTAFTLQTKIPLNAKYIVLTFTE